jgi:hypothetical protein
VFPYKFEPKLEHYFRRCLDAATNASVDAWLLLSDFDRLIEQLWGRRRFRVLTMPPRRRR